MLQIQRRNDIMKLLDTEKEMTVKELAAALFCSEATVRRDLDTLEKEGLLRRSFGGAVLSDGFAGQLPLSIRRATHIPAKKRIAARAASEIRSGMTLFLDASSTTYFLAPHLAKFEDLTVVTNNPHLNIALAEWKVHSLSTGGEMLDHSIALGGSDAERFLRGIRADLVFFSARGVQDGAIFDSSKAERDVKIAMIEGAARSIFLCDSSKIGQSYPYRITDYDHVDSVICENI